MKPTADARAQWIADQAEKARREQNAYRPCPPRDPVEDFHKALTSEPDPEPVGAPMLGVLLLILAALGMLLAASWLFYAGPAEAQERHAWTNGATVSYVELGPPTAPGALASVTFSNREVHSGSEVFHLDWQGITVRVDMEWQVDGSAERITVTPPEGIVAAPMHITVPEGAEGVLHLYMMGVGS